MTPHVHCSGADWPADLPVGVEGRYWTLNWQLPAHRSARAFLVGCQVAREHVPLDVSPDAADIEPSAGLAVLEQVHGARVVTVDGPGDSPACDAVVTRKVGLLLSIRVADCVPLFLVGRTGVGLAHAGWRGTVGHIAARTVERLAEETGEPPDSFSALIGPSIGPCCFEVGPEVADAFAPEFRQPPPGGAWPVASGGAPREHVDLWRANHTQLIAAGLRPEEIRTAALCTRCHQHLFRSYRGSGGQPGRIVCGLRLLPPTAG